MTKQDVLRRLEEIEQGVKWMFYVVGDVQEALRKLVDSIDELYCDLATPPPATPPQAACSDG